MNRFTASAVLGGTLGFVMHVVAPVISMMHFESRLISRELNGRTRTATFTDDILLLLFCYSRLAILHNLEDNEGIDESGHRLVSSIIII